MRLHSLLMVPLSIGFMACASSPKSGMLADGMEGVPRIVGVDTARPPRSLTVDLQEPAYVAVLVVAPGHSASLLYPTDSATDNRIRAGTTSLGFEIPPALVRNDSSMLARRTDQQRRDDEMLRARARVRGTRGGSLGPLPANTPTYLLLLTSQQALSYSEIIDKTAGVSIPLVDREALHAVGKAIRSTLDQEPRQMAGYFQLVELNRLR